MKAEKPGFPKVQNHPLQLARDDSNKKHTQR